MEKHFMKLRKRWMYIIPALALALFAGACAPKTFLKVQYQVPSPSSTLEGKKVALAVSDMRAKKTLLSENARTSLKNFNGTFSLVVLREDGSGNLTGVYDLVSLLTEVFQQRLKNEGIQVATVADNSAPELKIEILEFQLDFAERKWIVSMNYRASLLSGGSLLSKESVSGQAERLKVMGKSDAEKVLGELLTDMVNKLNLVNLFQQARQ
jgi:uncharacterized lipoprotein YajG